jgi:hypothetical protein
MVDTAAVGKAIHRGIEKAEDEVTRVFKGAVAGCIAGALASWAMNQYAVIEKKPVEARRRESAAAPPGPASSAGKSEKSEGGDDATVKTAQLISTRLLHHDLTESEKKIAGPAVHYGYGTLVGGLYGFLAEIVPVVGTGLGIPYATLLWLGGDEVAVPKLGLGKSVTETSPAEHASALASHFVYGVVLDIGRRIFKHLI